MYTAGAFQAFLLHVAITASYTYHLSAATLNAIVNLFYTGAWG